MKPGYRFAALGVLAALAACAGEASGTRLTEISKPRSDIRTTIGDAPRVVVLGTPPDTAPPEAVVAALQRTTHGAGLTLVPPDTGGGRLVVAFQRISAGALCTARSGGTGSTTLLASAAVCQGENPVSYGVVENRSVSSVEDPGFSAAFDRLLFQILTTRKIGGSPR